jgi:hypothetical protein
MGQSKYNELLQLRNICDMSTVNVLLDGVVRPWIMKVLGDLTWGLKHLVTSKITITRKVHSDKPEAFERVT